MEQQYGPLGEKTSMGNKKQREYAEKVASTIDKKKLEEINKKSHPVNEAARSIDNPNLDYKHESSDKAVDVVHSQAEAAKEAE